MTQDGRSGFGPLHMDRRGFLRRAAAVPAVAMLPRTAMAQEGPKKGGILRLGISNGATTDNLDTALYITVHTTMLGFTLRNALFELGPDNKLRGELVEEWEASNNASLWKLKLRQGIEFHNGKTLDANDVIASLNHHRKDGSPSPMHDYMAGVTRLEAPSPDTLLLELAEGDADFPYMMTDYHMGIAPADKDGNPDFLSGIGTGGYTLDTFEPGQSSTHSRFPNYWKEGAAHFDGAEIQIIADPTARIGALQAGEVDAVDEIDLKTIALLAMNPSIKIDEQASGKSITMPMMADVDPFTDNNVRMAMRYAFDRKQLVDTILGGHGLIGNDNPIAPNIPFYREFEQYEQDPDKAKHYLKQAGMERLKVQLSTSDAAFAGAVDAALLFSQSAQMSNIDVEIVQEPQDAYWGNVWSKKPFVMSSWSVRPTPGMLFSLCYASNANWNESHFKDDEFDSLLKDARTETDEAKRVEYYGRMQEILRERGATLVPFFPNEVTARSDKVAHAEEVASHLQFDGNKIIERWWFA